MHYDTLIIGAGMSGLAAGIRLAQYDKRVAILERHSLWGGLNSFYKLGGHRFDTGLHALTNFAERGARNPLTRVLRQLRIPYDALQLGEQSWSESVFIVDDERVALQFSNGGERMRAEVQRLFPSCVAGYERLLADLPDYADLGADPAPPSARAKLREYLPDALLVEMLMLPLCYYGSAHERDLEWDQFGVLFRSIFLEGFARPAGGIKPFLDLFVNRFKDAGGELRMRNGVARIRVEDGVARGVVLDDGTELSADQILSSAGLPETQRLIDPEAPVADSVGRLSFVETLCVLDRPPTELGIDATITFFNDSERFHYERPEQLVDVHSGVFCTPTNYADSADEEPLARVTVLADHRGWASLPEDEYRAAKAELADASLASVSRFAPDVRPHTTFRDVFTPRTIQKFTGRLGGAVYGSPSKRKDGRCGVENLHLVGTDQGMVGIVGALVSGLSIANRYALVPS